MLRRTAEADALLAETRRKVARPTADRHTGGPRGQWDRREAEQHVPGHSVTEEDLDEEADHDDEQSESQQRAERACPRA